MSPLLPIRFDDRVVVAEDEIKAIGVVRNTPDAARRDDPSQYFGEVLLANNALLPGLCLSALDKLLADAVLAIVDGDLDLFAARDLLEFDSVLGGAYADTLERVRLF